MLERTTWPREAPQAGEDHRVSDCHRHSSTIPSLSLFFLLCITDSSDHGKEEEEEDKEDYGFEEVAKVEPGVPVIHRAFLCKLERGTEAGEKDGLLQGHGKRGLSCQSMVKASCLLIIKDSVTINLCLSPSSFPNYKYLQFLGISPEKAHIVKRQTVNLE